MSVASRRLLQALVAVATATTAQSARAEGGYVLLGPLATPTAGHVPATGWGAELSTMYYEHQYSAVGFGAFAQAQSYVGSASTHGRYAAGIQAGYLLGGTLGLAYRSAADTYAGTTGVQFGPYASLGLISIGTRFVIPVSHGAGESYGFEMGLEIALKFPLPWGRPPPEFGHGRPLRVGHHDRLAPLARSRAWAI